MKKKIICIFVMMLLLATTISLGENVNQIVDEKYNFRFMNKNLADLLNIDNDIDMLTQYKCYEKLFRKDEPCSACPVIKVFDDKQIIRKMITYEASAEQVFDLDVACVPILNRQNDQVIAAGVFLNDVTETQLLMRFLYDMSNSEVKSGNLVISYLKSHLA